ncbi:hypothetical protein NPIL_165441, partial [Nephila pilipes]
PHYISNDDVHDDDGDRDDDHGGDDVRDDGGDRGDGRGVHGDDDVLPPLQEHQGQIGERRSSTWQEGLRQRTSCFLLF